MSNHVDRFYAAVSVIVSHGNIKHRLVTAFEENLATIDEPDLPRPVREKFSELRRLMTGVEPLNGEGHIKATVRKMSTREADDCAHRMLEIYTELSRAGMESLNGLDSADAEPIHIGGEKPRIPPFLIKNLNS
jgi:hypothetical protein